MDIRYTYYSDMYEYDLDIVFTKNLKKALRNIYKEWGVKEKVEDCVACTVTNSKDNSKYALIFKNELLTHNVIAHECLHLTAFVLADRNIDLIGGNEDYENAAWLNGHLNELVYNIILKEDLEVKLSSSKIKIDKINEC